MQIIKEYYTQIHDCVQNFNINIESLQHENTKNILYTNAIIEYKKLFLDLLLSDSKDDIENNTKVLVNFSIEHEISYLFIYSELITVIRKLLTQLLKSKNLKHVNEIDDFFTEHEYRITALYLKRYLGKLKFKSELKLSHIDVMPDKRFMIHYENHIKWIINLINYIENNQRDDNYPELNPSLCEFGKWMGSATTSYLISSSHFKQLDDLHMNLHDLGANVVKQCKDNKINPSTLIHLMQKIDYYSLEIGNEIAFLNEIEESAKDPLTHLLTRRLFNKIMLSKLDIAKVTGRDFALIMCDLDHFKLVNDTYGHAVGDIVLKDFSNVLESSLRKSDYIFRFGGEEFIVILPMTNKEEAVTLAQKICDATALQEVIIDNDSIKYTVSIGTISVLTDYFTPINQETIDKYVTEVDEKLYLAKERGRNRVE